MSGLELWVRQPEEVSLSAVEAAWLAALIDGEGTIGIYKQTRLENKSGYKYRAVIEIYNSHMPLMQKVASLLPGWLSLHNKGRAAKDNHKQLYSFMVSTLHIVDLVNAIMPYLIVKSEQARLVRRMCKLMHAGTSRESGFNHEVYESMYLQCKALNQRGVGSGP